MVEGEASFTEWLQRRTRSLLGSRNREFGGSPKKRDGVQPRQSIWP